MRIDVHSHFIPMNCFDVDDGSGRRLGPSMSVNGLNRRLWNIEARIKDMDAAFEHVQRHGWSSCVRTEW